MQLVLGHGRSDAHGGLAQVDPDALIQQKVVEQQQLRCLHGMRLRAEGGNVTYNK